MKFIDFMKKINFALTTFSSEVFNSFSIVFASILSCIKINESNYTINFKSTITFQINTLNALSFLSSKFPISFHFDSSKPKYKLHAIIYTLSMNKKEILSFTPMKIFQTVQKHLASIGYRANQNPFNLQQLTIIFMGILAIFSQCVYLFFIANTTKEFLDSILMTTIGILVFISNLSTVHKTATIFIFIDSVEKGIHGSMLLSTFENEYIDQIKLNFYFWFQQD